MSAKRGPTHGTTTAYTWHKCRCDVCREHWRLHGVNKRAQPKPRRVSKPAPRTEWIDQASCRRSVIGFKPVAMIGSQGGFTAYEPMNDQEWGKLRDSLFFPENESDRADGSAICAGCPVRAECLAEGMCPVPGYQEQLEYGIWGGLVQRERKRTYDRSR